jgi:hypothetical protein
MGGDGGLMVKEIPEERPPAVVTVMLAAPADAIKLAGTTADSSVALEYVVARTMEPHFAVETGVKFNPMMVSVKAEPPEAAEAGLRLISVGVAASASVAHANVRVTGTTTVNHRINERALSICNSVRVFEERLLD